MSVFKAEVVIEEPKAMGRLTLGERSIAKQVGDEALIKSAATSPID
jgi:hypothetical protein